MAERVCRTPEGCVDDFRPTGASIFRGVKKGTYKLNSRGKLVADMEYKNYIPTKIGTLEEREWEKRARKAIEEAGQEELLLRIDEYCKRLPWIKNDHDRMIHALSCFFDRAYEHWNGFTIIWM